MFAKQQLLFHLLEVLAAQFSRLKFSLCFSASTCTRRPGKTIKNVNRLKLSSVLVLLLKQ